MKKNVGTTDRIVRIIVAIILAVLYFAGIVHGVLGVILLILAIVLVITSVMSFCALYTLLGISTCPAKTQDTTEHS
ncbi:MAG: YgaP family membrane protein [Ignavibacteria bacterium]